MRGEAEGFEPEVDIVHQEVREVDAIRCFWLISIVEGKVSTIPVEAAHLIDTFSDVDDGLAGNGFVEVGLQVQSIARQM